MDPRLLAIFSNVPPKPDYDPVRKSIESSKDRPEVAAALKLFSSMPSSTAVLANPVRHHRRIAASDATLELAIRSFTIRGRLFEEDIVSSKADAIRVMFVGLFGRSPVHEEAALFREYLSRSLTLGIQRCSEKTCEFMKSFPNASPDIVIQHWASFRKAARKIGQINASRPPGELLSEMIEIHAGLWLDDGCPRTTATADHPSGDSTRSRYRASGPDAPYRSGNHIVGSQPPDRRKRFLHEQRQPITACSFPFRGSCAFCASCGSFPF